MYDYLIIGQGLAGSLLGYFLQKRGKSCYFVDAPEQVAASSVAAGIINPITGRRFVKSWRIDELVPFARQTYRALEQETGQSLFHERVLLRTLFNRGDENDWLARTGDPAYQAYMQDDPALGNLTTLTQPAFAYGHVRQAAQVNIGILVKALREQWQEAGLFRATAVDYSAIEVEDDGLRYQDISAQRLVFCEGWRSRFNPFFQDLPFGGNKGEILLVRLPKAQIDRILKHRVFIVPFHDDLYWIGSTSENTFTDEQPTEKARSFLQDRLGDVLQTPFEIVDHQAAVRPTVKDRRPFLGQHPVHQNLYLFNGLGTKGASLGPYWAAHLAAHLEEGTPLDTQVDISRWQKD